MNTLLRKLVKPLLAAALSISTITAVGVTIASSQNKAVEAEAYYTPSTHYSVSDTASELASYYSTISDSDTGTTLLSKLQSLNSTKRKRTVGYSGMGTDTSGAFIYTDYELGSTTKDSNGQVYGTKVASFYTKTSATSWNREHMWPNSHGGNNVEADILHTRPTISSENSSRGNSFYVEGKNNSSSGWDPYTAGYEEWVRGECARVILYCVVAYSNFTLSDADSHSTSNSNKDNMMGNMNTLIKWHFAYTPNEYEMNRNNGAEYLQGNRNPFVDHPEYVAKIWSGFNSTVSTLCTNNSNVYSNWEVGSCSTYGTNNAGTPAVGITSISESSINLAVDGSTTLSATSSNSGTISWSSSDTSVATVSAASASSGSSVTITAVGEGTATITAKVTISGTAYQKTCTVTVSSSGSSGGEQTGDGDYSITKDDLTNGSYPTTATSYTASSGLAFTAYNTANFSSKIQFKKSGGYIYNNSSLNLSSIKINDISGTLTVYAGTSSNPSSTVITGSNGTYNLSGYNYFKIINSSGSVATCSSIDVYTASSSTTKTLSSIAVSNATTSYTVGDSFVKPTVTATYSDASTANVTSSATFTGYNLSNAGNQTVTVSYTEGGVTKTTSYSITVNAAKTLSSIAVSTAPTKTSYSVGDNFDPTGLVIRRNYSDSTYDTYTYANHTSEFSFSPSLSTYLTTSNTSVTITYGGKTCTQAITVNASGGSSSTTTGAQRISASTTSSYYTTGDICPTGGTDSASTECDAFSVSWLKNEGTNSIVYTYAEMRIYASHSFTITPKTDYTITSVVITANSNSYASAVGGTSVTNCTKSVSSSTVTLTPTDGSSAVGFTNSAQSRINYIVVNYETSSGSSVTPTPSSETTYELITSGLSAGDKVVIVAQASRSATSGYALTSSMPNAYSFTPTSATISNQKLTYTSTMEVWEVSGTSGAYKFYSTSQSKYLNATVSGNYKNLSLDATGVSWAVTENANSNGYDVKATVDSTDVYLEYYNSAFKGYTSSNANLPLNFYKEVTASVDNTAETFASTFLSAIGCDPTGQTQPTFATGYSWSELGTLYSGLSSSEQNTLKTASALKSGTTIEQAMYIYDLIVYKYSYDNFIGRTVAKPAGIFGGSLLSSIDSSTSVAIIVIASLASLSCIAGLIYLRKRKEN